VEIVKRLGKISNQNGAAMVEFAIVLPLLLMLIFGMIEFSVMLYDKAMLTNATREGARFGILFVGTATGNSQDDIKETVTNYLDDNLISLGGASAPIPDVLGTCTAAGLPITVSVTYPYKFLVLPNFITSLAPTLTLGATTTMRCE
jgi:Flp pilus assembly protein TadG